MKVLVSKCYHLKTKYIIYEKNNFLEELKEELLYVIKDYED